METYNHNLSKMSKSELVWESRRVRNRWEDGDDEMTMYMYLLDEENKRRTI